MENINKNENLTNIASDTTKVSNQIDEDTSEYKKCEICGELFKPVLLGKSRKYCFNCVPNGLG